MLYRELILGCAIVLGLAAKSDAQDRWEGYYGGVSVTGYTTGSDVGRSTVHRHEAEGAGLGLHFGRNFVRDNGFVWGPEIAVSSLNAKGTKTDAALGTSEHKGRYLVSPRVRAGFATDRLFYYGIVGLGITDLGARSTGGSGKSVHAAAGLGLGIELALKDGWSTKLEATHYTWKNDEQAFGGSRQTVDTDITLVTFGLSKRF